MALTDGSGSVVDTYSYDPYGKVTPGGSNSVANPWQYTGGYLDSETGLVKLGQRYYDPSLGRFTQLDPLGEGYVYANDNPVNFTDPSGLFTTDPSKIRNAANNSAKVGGFFGAIGGAISGGFAGAVGGPLGILGGAAVGAIDGGFSGAGIGAGEGATACFLFSIC